MQVLRLSKFPIAKVQEVPQIEILSVNKNAYNSFVFT